MKRFFFLTALLLSFSFQMKAQSGSFKSKKEKQNSDNLNKRDQRGRKTGLWYQRKEAEKGEPAYSSFGSYVEGNKSGLWYQVDDEGRLVSIENFRNGDLDGTSQYYEQGQLSVIGNYRSLNRNFDLDSIYVTNPYTLYDTLVIVPSQQGSVRHGTWRYYDAQTGALVSEETYQVNNLISRKEIHNTSKTDSIYIQKKIEALPHNKNPKAKDKSKSGSLLYPELRNRR